jgi:hypothetical protein
MSKSRPFGFHSFDMVALHVRSWNFTLPRQIVSIDDQPRWAHYGRVCGSPSRVRSTKYGYDERRCFSIKYSTSEHAKSTSTSSVAVMPRRQITGWGALISLVTVIDFITTTAPRVPVGTTAFADGAAPRSELVVRSTTCFASLVSLTSTCGGTGQGNGTATAYLGLEDRNHVPEDAYEVRIVRPICSQHAACLLGRRVVGRLIIHSLQLSDLMSDGAC